jgi:hypothetical protein
MRRETAILTTPWYIHRVEETTIFLTNELLLQFIGFSLVERLRAEQLAAIKPKDKLKV